MILRAFVVIFISGVWWPSLVSAGGSNDESAEKFPYIGTVFYEDEAIKNATMVRVALLITPTFLVTTAIDAADEASGFPNRNLVARLGTSKISADENGASNDQIQEREVVEIFRPLNHSASQPWLSDFALLRVRLPFTVTESVNTTQFNSSPRLYTDHTCHVILFLKSDHTPGVLSLRKAEVKMLPQSTCSRVLPQRFTKDRSLCSAEAKDVDDNFCKINSGGPLICDQEIIGIYSSPAEESCAGSLIFQRFHYWDKFITCGFKEDLDHECEMIGTGTYKEVSTSNDTLNESTETISSTVAATTVVVTTITTIATNSSTETNTATASVAVRENVAFTTNATTANASTTTNVATTVTKVTKASVSSTASKNEEQDLDFEGKSPSAKIELHYSTTPETHTVFETHNETKAKSEFTVKPIKPKAKKLVQHASGDIRVASEASFVVYSVIVVAIGLN